MVEIRSHCMTKHMEQLFLYAVSLKVKAVATDKLPSSVYLKLALRCRLQWDTVFSAQRNQNITTVMYGAF